MKKFDTIFLEIINDAKIKSEVQTIPYSANSLILVSHQLDEPQIRIIEEATLKQQRVILMTSKGLSNAKKSQLLELMTDYDNNQENPDFMMFRIFKYIGYGLMVIGLVLLGLSFLMDRVTLPFYIENELLRLFVPIVLLYLGFVVVDWMDRVLVNRYKRRPNLELHILNKKLLPNKAALTILDEKSAYVTKKHDHFEIEMDADMVNKIASLIVEVRKMDKKSKIEEKKVAKWLYEG